MIAAALLVVFLVGVPLTALIAARWAAVSGLRAERAQSGQHQVTATLLHDAPAQTGSPQFPVPWPRVPARWASPSGPRTGLVPVQPGTKAGTAVTAWTDWSGKLTGVPVDPADITGQEAAAALAASVVLSALLLALWAYAGVFLDRRRMADWDADWARTEPQWTGRLRG